MFRSFEVGSLVARLFFSVEDHIKVHIQRASESLFRPTHLGVRTNKSPPPQASNSRRWRHRPRRPHPILGISYGKARSSRAARTQIANITHSLTHSLYTRADRKHHPYSHTLPRSLPPSLTQIANITVPMSCCSVSYCRLSTRCRSGLNFLPRNTRESLWVGHVVPGTPTTRRDTLNDVLISLAHT